MGASGEGNFNYFEGSLGGVPGEFPGLSKGERFAYILGGFKGVCLPSFFLIFLVFEI